MVPVTWFTSGAALSQPAKHIALHVGPICVLYGAYIGSLSHSSKSDWLNMEYILALNNIPVIKVGTDIGTISFFFFKFFFFTNRTRVDTRW